MNNYLNASQWRFIYVEGPHFFGNPMSYINEFFRYATRNPVQGYVYGLLKFKNPDSFPRIFAHYYNPENLNFGMLRVIQD